MMIRIELYMMVMATQLKAMFLFANQSQFSLSIKSIHNYTSFDFITESDSYDYGDYIHYSLHSGILFVWSLDQDVYDHNHHTLHSGILACEAPIDQYLYCVHEHDNYG